LFAHDARRSTADVLATLPSGWRNNPGDPQQRDFDGPHGEIAVAYRFTRAGLTAAVGDSEWTGVSHAVSGHRIDLERDGRRRSYARARDG
jgi:propionyl-CoA carboxylase alpha chain